MGRVHPTHQSLPAPSYAVEPHGVESGPSGASATRRGCFLIIVLFVTDRCILLTITVHNSVDKLL